MGEEETLPFPKHQRLRAPTGWRISKINFYDLEPKGKLLVDDIVNNKGWSLFEQDLLWCANQKSKKRLDMGWSSYADPNGKFMLSFVENDDWNNSKIIYETRSKTEIVAEIEQIMLRITRENEDYSIEAKNVSLQPLRFYSGWEIVKNELFEQLNTNGEMVVEGLPNEDGWQLMTEDLLHLVGSRDGKTQIRLGWFPAHDPNGCFNIVATTEKYFEPPLVDFSSRDKAEVVEIVEHLIKEIHKLKPNRK